MTQSLPPVIPGVPDAVRALGQAWGTAGDGVGSLAGEFTPGGVGNWSGTSAGIFEELLGQHFQPRLARAGQMLSDGGGHAINFAGLLSDFQNTDQSIRAQVGEAQSTLEGKQTQHSSTQASLVKTQAKYNAATDPVTKKQHESVLSSLGSVLGSLERDIENLVAEIAALVDRAWTNFNEHADAALSHAGLISELAVALAPIILGGPAQSLGEAFGSLRGPFGLPVFAPGVDGLINDVDGTIREEWGSDQGSTFGFLNDVVNNPVARALEDVGSAEALGFRGATHLSVLRAKSLIESGDSDRVAQGFASLDEDAKTAGQFAKWDKGVSRVGYVALGISTVVDLHDAWTSTAHQSEGKRISALSSSFLGDAVQANPYVGLANAASGGFVNQVFDGDGDILQQGFADASHRHGVVGKLDGFGHGISTSANTFSQEAYDGKHGTVMKGLVHGEDWVIDKL